MSIFINDINKVSKFKKSKRIYGNTNYKEYLDKNYINIPLKKNILQSSSKSYIKNFINLIKNKKNDIIEIHNRPSYVKPLSNFFNYSKFVLYFHNDPLEMNGSKSVNERNELINRLDKIIFNSDWSKKRFLKGLNLINPNIKKLEVIKQSVDPTNIDFKKKKNKIIFVGKLNTQKDMTYLEKQSAKF